MDFIGHIFMMRSEVLFFAFDPSSAEEQRAAAVQHPGDHIQIFISVFRQRHILTLDFKKKIG